MKFEIFKIIIIFSLVIFFNKVRSCPTCLGLDLLEKNKISFHDIEKLNENYKKTSN